MTSIDDYLAQLPAGQRAALQRVRDIVHATLPDVEETISYNMPTFKMGGKSVLHMAAFKSHLSLFGSTAEYTDRLVGFELSQKGTLQFTEDHPVPEDVIRDMVTSRANGHD